MSEKTILPVQPASVQPLRATGTVCGFAVRPGLFLLNGATPVPGGVIRLARSAASCVCSGVLNSSRMRFCPFRIAAASETPGR